MAKSICVDSVFHFISGFYDRQGPDLRHHYAGLRGVAADHGQEKHLKHVRQSRAAVYRPLSTTDKCIEAGIV